MASVIEVQATTGVHYGANQNLQRRASAEASSTSTGKQTISPKRKEHFSCTTWRGCSNKTLLQQRLTKGTRVNTPMTNVAFVEKNGHPINRAGLSAIPPSAPILYAATARKFTSYLSRNSFIVLPVLDQAKVQRRV